MPYCFHMAPPIDREALHSLRIANGWTMRTLAEKSKVSHTFISKIERGVAPRPSPETVVRLAGALGVKRTALTGDKAELASALAEAERSPKALVTAA